jgi:hydroxymethylglutaryl-CoA reductase (NADPH)
MNAGKTLRNLAVATKDCSSPFQEEAFAAAKRWSTLNQPQARAEIFDQKAKDNASSFRNNIESYIGTINVPVGLAGPLRIHGKNGSRDYRVPLATTEAALVASYSRGARLLTSAGGCNARVVAEAVSRTPMFAFNSLVDAEKFSSFIEAHADMLTDAVSQVTSHGKLVSVGCLIEGNHVYVDLQFTTGDASGQNMVTFASDAICKLIIEHSPIAPRYWFLEGNFSGDKKATAKSLGNVRGKRVVAEVTIPRALVENQLHTI